MTCADTAQSARFGSVPSEGWDHFVERLLSASSPGTAAEDQPLAIAAAETPPAVEGPSDVEGAFLPVPVTCALPRYATDLAAEVVSRARREAAASRRSPSRRRWFARR